MRQKSKRPAPAPEPVDPHEVAGAVADGLLIARSAATIGVANTLIVWILRDDRSFDLDDARQAVRDELGRLAREQSELATRMVETRTKALRSRGRSRHQFDYRPDDNHALASREAIYSTIASKLDALRDDDVYVDGVALAARDRAWNDIGSAIVSHARAAVSPGADYGIYRADRLQEFLEVDLQPLLERAARS